MFETIKRNQTIVELSMVFIMFWITKSTLTLTEFQTFILLVVYYGLYAIFKYFIYTINSKTIFEIQIDLLISEVLKNFKGNNSLEATIVVSILMGYLNKSLTMLDKGNDLFYFLLNSENKDEDFFKSALKTRQDEYSSNFDKLTDKEKKAFEMLKDVIIEINLHFIVNKTLFTKVIGFIFDMKRKNSLKAHIKSSVELHLSQF